MKMQYIDVHCRLGRQFDSNEDSSRLAQPLGLLTLTMTMFDPREHHTPMEPHMSTELLMVG